MGETSIGCILLEGVEHGDEEEDGEEDWAALSEAGGEDAGEVAADPIVPK